MIHRSPLQAWSLPLLVHPSPDEAPNLVAVVFEYMKRMPAQFCIERALNPLSRQVLAADGVFRADPEDSAHKASLVLSRRDEVVFVETSSGNMALGLAEACKQSGVALHLLLPASVDTVTKDAIVELGAVVEGIDTSD